jgi:hypothetical protein
MSGCEVSVVVVVVSEGSRGLGRAAPAGLVVVAGVGRIVRILHPLLRRCIPQIARILCRQGSSIVLRAAVVVVGVGVKVMLAVLWLRR